LAAADPTLVWVLAASLAPKGLTDVIAYCFGEYSLCQYFLAAASSFIDNAPLMLLATKILFDGALIAGSAPRITK
jgi:hypothetical protein